ncbi:hypothetical protein [uncultured Sphingomonas sp.]|uniref:DUF7946 domain-containing protein n=1 Tax=uncultured Sphingomonas sp. TaxID=158754 RepID=UPI0025FBD5C2|nr:hypothetical protein [uncultured Sphingomonas sp.]
MSDGFIIKFDGGDADYHAVDMRLLGESLQGIDRIASDLLVAVLNSRAPRKGERTPFVVKAYEPRPGTLTIPVEIQEGAAFLQLGWQIFGPSATDILANWFKAVLLHHGGKETESKQALEYVAELAKSHNDALTKIEANRHDEVMGMQAILGSMIDRLGPAATQTVAPVGPSVRRLWFFSPRKSDTPQFEISIEDADRIREKSVLEWSALQQVTLQTDGYVFHNRRLSIVNPYKNGFLSAEFEDPVAEVENNPYAVAGARKALISVDAKLGFRAGSLERVVIMNFISEHEEAA